MADESNVAAENTDAPREKRKRPPKSDYERGRFRDNSRRLAKIEMEGMIYLPDNSKVGGEIHITVVEKPAKGDNPTSHAVNVAFLYHSGKAAKAELVDAPANQEMIWKRIRWVMAEGRKIALDKLNTLEKERYAGEPTP